MDWKNWLISKFFYTTNYTRIMGLLAVLVASKTGCRFVADVSLLKQRLRNSFIAAETFQLGMLFLKRLQQFFCSIMTVTAALMAAKKAKGMSFADLEAAMGLDEVWIASLFYGQATASKEEAEKLAELLSLDPAITAALQEFPTKGSLDPVIPTDPLIYRFYEIMQVYGMPMKDVIQEHFGDGIMSAIDFTLDVDKVEDPKGDRVKITMCGKFLPYKKW